MPLTQTRDSVASSGLTSEIDGVEVLSQKKGYTVLVFAHGEVVCTVAIPFIPSQPHGSHFTSVPVNFRQVS